MLIDWFTVVAQAVNFLILAWLLKHFLYAPVMEAMQTRRERIAKELEEADAKRLQAEARAGELSVRSAELEQQAGAMLEQARKDADERREQWLSEAKADVEEHRRAWFEEVERERVGLSGRLRMRMAGQAVALAEKVLRDLAGEDLERHTLEYFLKRLDSAAPESPLAGHVAVRTGFSLSDEAVNRFRKRICERFPQCTGVEAIRDETLGFGIVMVAGNVKLEWNMVSYLDNVEEAVFDELARIKAET